MTQSSAYWRLQECSHPPVDRWRTMTDATATETGTLTKKQTIHFARGLFEGFEHTSRTPCTRPSSGEESDLSHPEALFQRTRTLDAERPRSQYPKRRCLCHHNLHSPR